MRAGVAVVAGIVGLSFACGEGETPAPGDPAPEVSAPSPGAPARGKRKGGGPKGDQCAPAQAEFATKAGKIKGLRAVVKALDPMTGGEGTRYEVAQGTKLPCKVDLAPVQFYDDAIDTVGLTSDGRGLLFSAGTSDVRGIQILDLDTGEVWQGAAVEKPRVEGDALVVRKLGEAVPSDRPWPAGCDEALKSQMSCSSWEEIRWQGGSTTPTGASGGVITQ